MDDVVGMGEVERAADAAQQHAHFVRRHRAGGEPLLQRDAVDELHHHIGTAKLRFDEEAVVAHDGVVGEIAQDHRLALEQSHDFRLLGHLGLDELDGDRIAGIDRDALIDLAHAASRDQPLDLENAVEALAGPQASLRRGLKNRLVVHPAGLPMPFWLPRSLTMRQGDGRRK